MIVEDVLNRMIGRRVLVIGDVMLDKSIYCERVRKANEFDGDVLREVVRTFYPGGAANVAMNCRALGAQVTLLGTFGTDLQGRHLVQSLTEHLIEVPTVSWVNRQWWGTTTKTRIYVDGKLTSRIDDDQRGCLDAQQTMAVIRELQPEVVLFSDYQKGVFTYDRFVREVSFCVLHNCWNREPTLLTVNPKPALVHILPGANLISVNNDEFRAVRGSLLQEVTSEPTPRMSQFLIRTLGAAGLDIYSGNGNCRVRCGPDPVENPDVVGCGDTAFAAASLSLLSTTDPLVIGKIAVAAGKAKAKKRGTMPVTPEEILDVYKAFEPARSIE